MIEQKVLIMIIIIFVLCITLSIIIQSNATEEYNEPSVIYGGGNDIREESIPIDTSTCSHSIPTFMAAHNDLINIDPIIAAGPAYHIGSGNQKKGWRQYDLWTDLIKDEIAYSDYLEERKKLIENPVIEWDAVLKELKSKLQEPREYMILIDVVDGIASIQKIEASATSIKTEKSKNTFASVNTELYERFVKIPALISAHTHPSDTRCDPFPSASDIFLMITKSAYNRYAGDVVICRFGVIFYGLDQKLSIDLLTNNFPQSVNVYVNDVIMAHQAMRSWTSYSYLDYVSFFKQFRIFFHVYPTPEYVAFQDKKINKRIINHPIDLDLIEFTISVLRKENK